jgi:hypothetical protein
MRREDEARQQREAEIDEACEELAEEERLKRVECARYIHIIDDVLSLPPPWTEEQWSFAAAISELRNADLLPTYVLLAFGRVAQRIHFLMAGDRERAEILAALRWKGGVIASDGHFVETVTT